MTVLTRTPKCKHCKEEFSKHATSGFFHCPSCDASGKTGIAKRGGTEVFWGRP